MRITELQKRRIKQLVDELVVGKGRLEVRNPNAMFDGVKEGELVRLAFKYYRMIYSGEQVFVPRGSREWYRCMYCPDKCEEFLRLNAPGSRAEDGELRIPTKCPKGADYMPSLDCTNCGDKYQHEEITDDEAGFVPICPVCAEKIGQDMEIIRDLIS